MSGRSSTQPWDPSSALTWSRVSEPTFWEPMAWRCSPQESKPTRGELRSGALCIWTGTVAITQTAPTPAEGLTVGRGVRAWAVGEAPLLGDDCPNPQALPTARPTARPTRQVATGTNRIIRLTSALE